ncbi:hypothetical protein HPB51_002957 [Rhipicephalus microplus]|uniref:Uncharacterized protein n=1 Tax=Rhipicephalus microplus TaxID=6941 RepID=A0A9J6DS67_RHIMP|nr:hypothetical protein HPB51_002957 [Rhipicephalus microplus]
MAGSLASTAISPPPPFLATPGTSAIPWTHWKRLLENFLLVSGAADLPAAHRRALLLHCLGPEGQCIFDALPPTPTAPQLPTTEALAAAPTLTGEGEDRDVAAKQKAAASFRDIYDAACNILPRHFAGARNIRLERIPPESAVS